MVTRTPPAASAPPAAPAADTTTPVSALFQVYNTFTGSACATAVTGTASPTGASERCDYTVCTDFHSLLQALSISTSATDDFLEGSVDAKATFVNGLHLTTYSVTVLVYASVITGDLAYTDVQPPASLPTPACLDQFFPSYGDCFVSSLTVGAEYIAAFVFYAQSKEEQTAVTSALSAQGITEEGDLTASVAAGLQVATTTPRRATPRTRSSTGSPTRLCPNPRASRRWPR